MSGVQASTIRVSEVSTIRVSGWDKERLKSRRNFLIPFAYAMALTPSLTLTFRFDISQS